MSARSFDSAQGRPFVLRVIQLAHRVAGKHGEGEYGLALSQQPVRSRTRTPQGEESQLVVRLWGTPFRATVDRILAALKDNGYRAVELSKSRKAPFLLSEESGVRLGLLFLAVKPLRKLARIEAVSSAIWAMGPEEAYYWFSKCTALTSGRRARRALRLLLSNNF
jgi:hypothetical protein